VQSVAVVASKAGRAAPSRTARPFAQTQNQMRPPTRWSRPRVRGHRRRGHHHRCADEGRAPAQTHPHL